MKEEKKELEKVKIKKSCMGIGYDVVDMYLSLLEMSEEMSKMVDEDGVVRSYPWGIEMEVLPLNFDRKMEFLEDLKLRGEDVRSGGIVRFLVFESDVDKEVWENG